MACSAASYRRVASSNDVCSTIHVIHLQMYLFLPHVDSYHWKRLSLLTSWYDIKGWNMMKVGASQTAKLSQNIPSMSSWTQIWKTMNNATEHTSHKFTSCNLFLHMCGNSGLISNLNPPLKQPGAFLQVRLTHTNPAWARCSSTQGWRKQRRSIHHHGQYRILHDLERWHARPFNMLGNIARMNTMPFAVGFRMFLESPSVPVLLHFG